MSGGGARSSLKTKATRNSLRSVTMPLLYPSLIFQVFLSFSELLRPGVAFSRLLTEVALVSDEVLGIGEGEVCLSLLVCIEFKKCRQQVIMAWKQMDCAQVRVAS